MRKSRKGRKKFIQEKLIGKKNESEKLNEEDEQKIEWKQE